MAADLPDTDLIRVERFKHRPADAPAGPTPARRRDYYRNQANAHDKETSVSNSPGRVHVQTRRYQRIDEEPVVELSLRAWTPVFTSLRQVLGDDIFVRLHGDDWRTYQDKAVRDTLADNAMTVWVAHTEHEVVGFVAATVLDPRRSLGEIRMLAVDPSNQGRGIGTCLTTLATNWLRDQGMQVAMIGTGGDPGHAPARRAYEKADYTVIPLARYFKAL